MNPRVILTIPIARIISKLPPQLLPQHNKFRSMVGMLDVGESG